MKKFLAIFAWIFAFLFAFMASASASFSWVTLVTSQQASVWSWEVVAAVVVLVWAIVTLWGFLITKYFGNRILSFLERILSR